METPMPGPWSRARWIIHTQLAALSPGRKHSSGIHTRSTGFIPFTSPACDSVAAAWQEARRDSHRHWNPGHLLLGLAAQDDSVAAQALHLLGVNRHDVRQQATQIKAGQGQHGTPSSRHPAKSVISAVLAEAAANCDERIGTGHLLLALYRADDQAAAQALTELGAGENQARNAITAVLAETGPED
jgi:ATP-dependent Clp protease ATP-binding subunit ClpA